MTANPYTSTEIKVSSISLPLEWQAYCRERLATARIAGLVLLLWLLAAVTSPPASTSAGCVGLLLTALLVVQFRLWDDLADLRRDRIAHPQRVLVRSTATQSFIWLAGMTTLPVLCLLQLAPDSLLRVGGYVLIAACVAGLYVVERTAPARPAWVSLALLLKYAGFVLLITPEPGRPLVWLAAAAAFAIVALVDRKDAKDMATSRPQPAAALFEANRCPGCDTDDATHFVDAEDDLTGKPGVFRFVTCRRCGLSYQSPRLRVDAIAAYYDDEYIAHRKKTDWGWLTPLYRRAMDKHDRAKVALVQRYCSLDAGSSAIDVGCGAGSFIARIHSHFGCRVSAVDFKDLSAQPWLKEVQFHHSLFYEQDFGAERFDLITMWHFLEHDYQPRRTLAVARDLLTTDGRLIIEVPRLDSLSWTLYGNRWPGLQAPQHTALYNWRTLEKMVGDAGLEIVDHLPYGAFPAYFYLFAGLAFKWLRGRGLNLERAIVPYFIGQTVLSPLLLFERQLNLAMQTIVCRKPAQVQR
jgi:SAM-dependent methyltransferase